MPDYPLDKYNEERLLGQGGFGSVYLYCLKPEIYQINSSTYLPATVAVKRIVVTGSIATASGELYAREYELLKGLRHMNIVELFGRKDVRHSSDIVEVNLIMEHCHADLRSLLNLRGRMSPVDSSILIKQALAGLKYLHHNDIVHRDLKPENILLQSTKGSGIDWSLVPAKDIQVKITDFGLAKFYNHDDTSFTMTVAGTPFYMCPEMWEAMLLQQPFRGDWSVDLYSMGVIAYELLAGGRKEDKTGYSNSSELVAEFSAIHPDIPDFLLSMMHDNPSRRTSAESLLSHRFIQIGRQEIERQGRETTNESACGLGIGAGQSSETIEVLKVQLVQFKREKEKADQVIGQLARQLSAVQGDQERASIRIKNLEDSLGIKDAVLQSCEARLRIAENRLRKSESNVSRLQIQLQARDQTILSLQSQLSSLKSHNKPNAKNKRLEDHLRAAEDKLKGAETEIVRLKSLLMHKEDARTPFQNRKDIAVAANASASSNQTQVYGRALSAQEQEAANKDLWFAAYDSDLERVRNALARGANVEHYREVEVWPGGWYRCVPLGVASSKGNLPVVLCLLEAGADVNGTGGKKWTALHYAAKHGHDNIIKVLLCREAELESVTESGQTPLMFASEYGNLSCMRLLLQKGANPFKRDSSGNSAVTVAGKWRPGKKEEIQRALVLRE